MVKDLKGGAVQWDVPAVLEARQSGKGRAGGEEAKLGLGSHPGGSQPQEKAQSWAKGPQRGVEDC